MRIGRRCAAAALLIATFAGGVHAASEEQARDLHTLSGFQVYVDSYPQQMRIGIEQQAGAVPPLLVEAMRRALERPLDMTEHHDAARRLLAERVTAAQAEAVLAWLRSPLGRRLTELEVERSAPDVMAHMMAFAQELQRTPATARRTAQMSEMMEVLDVQSYAEQLWIATAVAVGLGANAALPQGERLPAERIREEVSGAAERLRPALMQGVELSLLYVYQPVPDDELDIYIAYLRTPAARAFSDATVRALMDTLGSFSYRFGEMFADEVRRALSQRQG